MQNKSDYIDNEIGKQLKGNRLIIMDDVSGPADKSTEFSNFLIVSRKYGFSYNISRQAKLENDNVSDAHF